MSLRMINASFTYMKKTPFEKKALSNVSFEVQSGGFTGIIGHTGSGKSTLIQHFNGLLRPDEGKVEVDGTDIGSKGAAAKTARRKVGIVFQYPEQQLFEETVEKDISYGPKNYGIGSDGVKQRVREAMEMVGMDYGKYAQRSPFALSGGQMRRVAMAGILALKPDYLVLDEPTAGLDPRGRKEILRRIEEFKRSSGCSVVMISHNMDEIVEHCDRVIVMAKGRILLDDVSEKVFTDKDVLDRADMSKPNTMKLLEEASLRGLNLQQYARNRGQCLKELLTAYEVWQC